MCRPPLSISLLIFCLLISVYFTFQSCIREKLAEHQFEVPEELCDAHITDLLGHASFESKINMKKKGSNLKLLAQNGNSEESKATDNKESAKRHPPTKRENSNNKEPAALRVGEISYGGVPASPSSGMKGVRRTGSTTSNLELKHDNSGLQQQQGLAVAGNGVGPRTTTSTGISGPNIGRAPPSFRGSSPAITAEGAGIRGDRVRGGAMKGRVLSEKAMSRYQVRPVSIGNNKQPSDSKLSNTEHQNKETNSSKSSPNEGDSPDNAEDTAGDDGEADAKDDSDYEEDFEEYDGDNNWDQTVGQAEDSPQFSSAAKAGAANVGIAAADDKPLRRDSQDATISRHMGMGMKDSWEDDHDNDAGDKNADPCKYSPASCSFRTTGRGVTAAAAAVVAAVADPFYSTDGSMSISDQSSQVSYAPQTGTMNGEADLWNAVWTQNRGIIDKPSSRQQQHQQKDINGTVTVDIGAHMYRDNLHQTDDIYAIEEDLPRNSETSDDGGFEIEVFISVIYFIACHHILNFNFVYFSSL